MKMNKLYKWFFLLLVVLACSKEFDDVIVDSFDFNFTVLADDSGFVYENSPADFRIVPERTISTTVFNFSYSVTGGDGYFQDNDGNIIEQEEIVQLEDLLFTYNYIPLSVGTHTIEVVASDNKGSEVVDIIEYEADYAPFTVLLNGGANTYVVNQENDVNLTVVSDANPENYETFNVDGAATDYSVTFTVSGGTGTFILNGEEYSSGETITVDPGTIDFSYLPTTVGVHTITMVAKAPDGATREEVLVVTVDNVSFFILANTPSNTLSIGSEMDISLSLQSSDTSGDIDYSLAFFYAQESEGIGELRDENGMAQIAGQPRALEPGNYNYSFSADVLGEKKLYFDVTDSNNQVKRDSVLINVTSVPFTFSGQAVGTETGINQSIDLSLSLSSNAGADSDISYNISFVQSSGNGQLVDEDGQIIPPSTAYNVEPGVFNLFYTPTSLGEHNLVFTATDSFGQSVESSISLMATNAQLNFSASVTNSELVLGRDNTVSVTLAEVGNTGGLTYEMNYFVTGGSGSLTNSEGGVISPSEYFVVEPGTEVFSFTPSLPGNYTLTFNLRDSNGQTLETSTSFVTINTEFQFTAVPANSEVGLGQNNNINFNIVPGTTNNGTTYSMTYTSSSNGSLNIGGTSYGPGQTIVITGNTFVGIYNPLLTGEYNLVFTVVDSNGVTREDSASFNVSNSDFVLNVATNNPEISLDETTTLNVDISQAVQNPSASYELSYSVVGGSGTLSNGSTDIGAGEFVSVGVGTTAYVYVPESEGTHAITVTVRDNSGETKEETIIITVSGRDYTLSAIAASGTSNIGEPVPVNLNIVETGGSGGTYDVIVASTGNGNINYNGTSYTFGEAFTVNGGQSTFNYISSSTGSHTLTITTTASYGIIKTANVAIDFNSLEYSFTAAAQNPSISVGESTLINFNVGETVGNSTYEMRYVLNGQNATLTQGGSPRLAGSLYPINIGNSSYVITGSEVGTVNVTFTVTNANGLESVQTVEINVVSRDFNFLATESQGNAIVGQSVGITFNITESVSGIDSYTVVYSTTGTGSLEINGGTVNPGATFSLSAGTSSGVYTGTDGGEHTITFTALSSSGTEKVDDAVIVFDTNSYSFSATETKGAATLPESVGINFNLTESIPGIDTYTAIFSNTNNGTLVFNGNVVNPGQSFVIAPGSSSATYTPDNGASGTHELDFQVLSSGGVTVNDLATIVYGSNEFGFVASAANTNANLGDDVNINFSLTETVAGLDTYTAIFSNDNNGTFIYNGNTISPGQSFEILVGNSSATYSADENGTGEHNLEFTVNSSSGDSASDTVEISFLSNEFTFTANEQNADINLGDSVGINFNINETITGLETYTAIFSNSNNGVFVYNGQTISAGTSFTISAGNSSATYTPSSDGTHTLNFVVTSSGNNTSSDSASVDVSSNDFTFSATEQSVDVNLGEDVEINFNINETISGIETYTAIFSNNNNGTFVYGGVTITPGTSFVVSAGNSSGTYTPSADGSHSLDFTVTSSGGNTDRDSASINVSASGFDFTLLTDKTSVNLTDGEIAQLTFDINSLGSQNFTWSFTSGIDISLFDSDSNVRNENIIYNINEGESFFNTFSLNEGLTDITVTVMDEFGNSLSQTVSIDFYRGIGVPTVSQKYMIHNLEACRSAGNCPGTVVGKTENVAQFSMVLSFIVSGVDGSEINFYQVELVENSGNYITIGHNPVSRVFNRSASCISVFGDETVNELIIINTENTVLPGLQCAGETQSDPYLLYAASVTANNPSFGWTLRGDNTYRVRAVLNNGDFTPWGTVDLNNNNKIFAGAWAWD